MVGKKLYLLFTGWENKQVFNCGWMVSFQGVRKISSCLVMAKSYLMHRVFGKSTRDVPVNVTDIDFTSTAKSKSFNHKFDWNDECFIYLLTCKIYQRQFFGKSRWIEKVTGKWNFARLLLSDLILKTISSFRWIAMMDLLEGYCGTRSRY